MEKNREQVASQEGATEKASEQKTELSKKLDELRNLPVLIGQLQGFRKIEAGDSDMSREQEEEMDELQSKLDKVTGTEVYISGEEEDKEVERIISGALQLFFEKGSKEVPAVELASGGNINRDALKYFPDGRILFREVRANYDIDEKSCSFIGVEGANEILAKSIGEDRDEIEKLSERRNAAQALREKLEIEGARESL